MECYWIQNDHLGRPLALTDESGDVVWRWLNADAFGNAGLIDEDPENDSTDLSFNLRFPGQYADSETGLWYNYFRDYDPRTGRYITSDPIGLEGGLNTYSYALNNPLRYTDPTGEISAFGAGLIIIGGFTAYKLYILQKCVEKCAQEDDECEKGDTSRIAQCKRDCFFEIIGAKAKKGPRTKL